MGISIILLVLLGLLTVLYFWMKRNYSYWRNKNVPSIEPSPIFGNIQDIMLMKTNPAVHMANLYNHQNAHGQPLVGIYVFNKPAILLRDLDLIKTVMVKDFNKFSNRFASCDPHGDPLGFLNLFFIKNVQWKELRNKLTPVFTSGKLKQMYPLIAEIGTELDDHLCKITQDSTNCIKEVKEISAAFTTDVIATVAFGLRANSIQDPNSGFRKEGRELFKWTTMKSFEFLAIFFLPRLVGLFGCKTFSLKAANFIRETINYTMDERIRTGTIRNDLIDALVTIKKTARSEGEDLNNEILVAQAAVFFSAGFETTSSTISFGLYELSKAQECQKRLREEIKEKLSKSKGQITYEILQEMDYLHMVVLEVMRMYPSLPFLDRECTLAKGEEDFLLDEELNVRVPHGMPVYISTYALHRDPTYFTNPDEFDPERFSPENKANIRPMTYMPFGAGPHNCIGERLGIVQAKIGLISFLRSHYVTICEKSHKSLVLDPKAVLLQAKGGLYCKLVRDPLFDKQ